MTRLNENASLNPKRKVLGKKNLNTCMPLGKTKKSISKQRNLKKINKKLLITDKTKSKIFFKKY